MSSLAAAQAELVALLSSLPPSSNPYLTISSFLKAQLYPDVPRSAVVQLYVLSGILGLFVLPAQFVSDPADLDSRRTALLVAIALLMRAYKRIFWILRMQQSPRLLRPNAIVSWAVIALAMLALFEVLIWQEIRFFNGEVDGSFAFWILLVWGMAWWGGHTAAWSLGVSFLVHLHTTNSRFPTHHFVPILNIGGAGLPVIYAAVLLPLGALGGGHYRNALDLYTELDNLLLASAEAWTPGSGFNVLSLAPLLPILQQMMVEVNAFVSWFRAVFVFYAITAALLVIYLVIIAVLHLSSLRRMLKETSRNLSSSNNFASMAEAAPARNHQQQQVRRTLRSLSLTIIAFSLLGTFFCAISITASVSPLSLITSPSLAQAIVLGPLWAFSVCGLPCAGLLVIRAKDASPNEEFRASAGSHKKSGSGGRKRSGGFGSGARMPNGENGSKDLPTEFSIQLSTMPNFSGERSLRGGGLDVADEKADEGERGLSGWLNFANSEREQRRQRSSASPHLASSVGVQVDVDVAVEEQDDGSGLREKTVASFLHV
ncbi:hypothetical protein JCM11251_001093 [Rhodosporidiobolus azoricus]